MTYENISDIYKDARGFRPSIDWLNSFYIESIETQEKIQKSLLNEVEASIQSRKLDSYEGKKKFQKDVEEILDVMLVPNRKRAIFLLVKSFCKTDADFEYFKNDPGYFTYQYGFYDESIEDEIKKALDFMMDQLKV